MNCNIPSSEKPMTPKEISGEFRERMGITVSEQFVRYMLKAGVRRMGMYARFSDVVAWWEQNPDFSPRGGGRRRASESIGVVD